MFMYSHFVYSWPDSNTCVIKFCILLKLIYWSKQCSHDNVIKWKHFPHCWPFVRGINRWPVNSPHKGQWPGALMFSFICVWINNWVNNREAGDLRRYRAHYDVILMVTKKALAKASIKPHFFRVKIHCLQYPWSVAVGMNDMTFTP